MLPLSTYWVQTNYRSIHTSLTLRNEHKETPEDGADLPWYLRPQESPQVESPLNTVAIPELPADSPQSLELIVAFLAEKLGISDLQVFDMRGNDAANEGAREISDFMVIGTGKSVRHLQKASQQLNFFIKSELSRRPRTEGLVSPKEIATLRRRLRRKGKGAPTYAKFDYGATPNSWVMTDCREEGIYVHMLTKDRRADLNLEELWAKDKAEYQHASATETSDNIFSGLRRFHTQRQVDRHTAYRQRFAELRKEHLADYTKTPLSVIQDHYDSMQASGITLDPEDLNQYFDLILQSPQFHSGVEFEQDAFNKRYNYFIYVLKRYTPNLRDRESVRKILPLLGVAGSQIDNDRFVTLDKLNSLTDAQMDDLALDVFKYSPVVNKLYKIATEVTERDPQLRKEMDLLCLTIFANRKNWFYARRVVDNALKTEDLDPLRAYMRLLSVKGDQAEIQSFLDDYYPLLTISPEFDVEVESRFVRRLLNRCDPEGSHYDDVRDALCI